MTSNFDTKSQETKSVIDNMMLTDDLYVHKRRKDQIDFSLSYFNFMPESLSFKIFRTLLETFLWVVR